jgi:hypothetical protein
MSTEFANMNLDEICQVPVPQRGEAWEKEFFRALVHGKIEVIDGTPKNDFDGWPYLYVRASEQGDPAPQVLDWLSTRGIGLLLNPEKSAPDYVINYGMIWNQKETGQFLTPTLQSTIEGSITLESGQPILAGPPHEKYLPTYVRNILREFLQAQSILMPKVLVMSTDRINYDLCFSVESLGNPPKAEHMGIAEAIAWFLPPHYAVALISEKGLPPFIDL